MRAMPGLEALFEGADPFKCRHEGIGVPGCPTCDPNPEHVAAAYRWLAEKRVAVPVPMLLWCPGCGERHIDEGVQATKEHRTHACQACGMLWAPAVVATVGVRFLPGCKDAPAGGGA